MNEKPLDEAEVVKEWVRQIDEWQRKLAPILPDIDPHERDRPALAHARRSPRRLTARRLVESLRRG